MKANVVCTKTTLEKWIRGSILVLVHVSFDPSLSRSVDRVCDGEELLLSNVDRDL